MSEAKVSEWHVDRWGAMRREFDDEKEYAASAWLSGWIAWRRPFASSDEIARGTATNAEDAMAKADAQLRAWGLL